MKRVLSDKVKMPPDTVAETEAFLRQEAAVISKGSGATTAIRDPDEREGLAQAIEGLADVLVTGDRDLLDVADPTISRGTVTARVLGEAPRRELEGAS